MAQIAQQDHIIIQAVISMGEEGGVTIDENAQKEVRRHYVRGTLHDAILKTEYLGAKAEIKVCTIVEDTDKEVTIQGIAFRDMIQVRCGILTEDDYKD